LAVWPRWVGALLAGALATGVAFADDRAPGSQSGEERLARALEDAPLESPEKGPIERSVAGAVDKFIRERTPCGLAGEGVPCFPTAVEKEAPEYSVEESLRDLRRGGPPVPPGAPTAAEIVQAGANPRSASASVGGGADLPCKAKQLLRKLIGKSKDYYVYRVWDATGERGVLREEPLDPEEFVGAPEFHYELVGRFGDDCEALKAYRKVGHDARVQGAVAPPHSISTSPP
jgi:hypothetical protein